MRLLEFTYFSNREASSGRLCGDVGHHRPLNVTDEEAGSVDAVAVVDNAYRRLLLYLSLEPHRHRELVHFIVGKPRTQERNLKMEILEMSSVRRNIHTTTTHISE